MRNENNWQLKAANYFTRRTKAMREVVERFVQQYWQTDMSNEENLAQFEEYMQGINAVFCY